ncbi:DUF1559 domain-containing protein [Singulisphaera acidiphila]|uniref:DUF1559 domain-containing protein n=1 Tax=Singulisphaera acidiphila (strain ATCC BAA-1392 / DSM 18658 / VKM B-2454 / MOB10) TaxID=886293 RepID=L0D7W3_SINAD|nr:DUF1559 domain-containing protein [Singulisphaera acidiphila]AGA25337.1 Protein of unknown function (DUF1559) [Singulisphaera acidiphila DSM 18658]
MMFSTPLIVLLAIGAPPPEAEGAAKAAAIAPFLGDEVAAVAHFDLARLNVQSFVRSVAGTLADEEDISLHTKTISDWVDALRKAGTKDLFLLVDPSDLPGVPILVVPLSDATDGRAVAKVLAKGGPRTPGRWPNSETIRGALVAGPAAALTRIREAKPEARPDIATALTAGGNAVVQIAIVPSTTQRRAIEESMPNLPPELGGAPITALSRGLRWASLAIASDPKPAFHAIVQAQDADAAKSLRKIAQDGFKLLAQNAQADPGLTEVIKTLGQTTPQIQGDRIILEADLEKTAALIAVPIRKVREAARRSQCVNNLKQIGLAMHNYHATYNSFPPAYSTSKDDKPLLSWRVHILPYLEQKSLYDQFKLDEPWDSPHNKALISRMPTVYTCPSSSGKLAKEGKTSYLTPRGPSTIFPGATGVKIQEITDGTSNTILVIDANDDAAVTWTKPDDWEVPTPFTTKGLFGHHPNGTSFGFADGSVRFLRDTLAPHVILKLLSRNGSEVISSDDL